MELVTVSPAVADLLTVVEPRLAWLATPAALDRLRRPDVAGLPALSGLLLECPLSEPGQGEPVGLALRAAGRHDDDELRMLADRWPEAPSWRGVAGLVAARQHDGRLAAALPELWVELDLDAAWPDAAAPSVFAKVDTYHGRPPTLGPHAAARRADSAAVLARAVAAAGVDLPAAGATLDRALDAMPASAALSYVGAMLGRPVPSCRLTVERMPIDGACQVYLRALGWEPPGGQEALRDLVGWVGEHARAGVLHADLLADGSVAAVGERVGLELPGSLVGDAAFRAALAARGLAQDEALAAVAAWPFRRHRSVAADWPEGLRRHDSLSGGVNHLKLVLEPAPWRVTVKAYFAVAWGRGFPVPALWGGQS